ncbi:peptidoglycan bridge formation glycyltransferase FemA/FemB family protein [Candidatus Gottesmanbacteria bacterium]|nr:peptidoglycan bridge formation glycyltransferase FemA/FemB family protein [Candidatus Gottesmanbacteria bacterium]
MKDIRQSPQFARFMHDIGWQVEKIDSAFIYLRKFPIFGYFAKIPRINPPFPFSDINKLIKNKGIFQLKIAPFIKDTDRKFGIYKKQILKNKFKIDMSPFNPTVDIYIDLTQKEDIIFSKFSSAKRRAVRRAIKNGIVIKESDDLESFIQIRKKQYFPAGFLVVSEMKKLWRNFYPKSAVLLLAYPTIQNNNKCQMQAIASICHNKPLAGILLLFYEHVAYYWFASASKEGKKIFAPTLLVWEALKVAKRRGCKIFAFEGIYDGRFPKAAESWKGFTKFKEGFGGEKVIYLENFKI